MSTAVALAVSLASCAKQAARPTPPPPTEQTQPHQATVPSAPKPKPKPKPAQKPETKETESAAAAGEGIEPANVGYYVDTLYGRLRQLRDTDLTIDRQDNDITLDVTHGFPAAGNGCAMFASVATALVEYRMTRVAVDVVAVTNDDEGRRAAKATTDAIAACLIEAGVASRRITTSAVSGVSHAPATTLHIEPVVRGP